MFSPELSGNEADERAPAVVGFDLAGRETRYRPSEFKHYFLPLFRNYLRITIHAGEEIGESKDQAIENIWEALYELHADRIGHGLDLSKNRSLMKMVTDRQITMELCPTSNYQTQNFHNFTIDGPREPDSPAGVYPLDEYYREGLNVTVNTDNWGISMTTLSDEYLQAARLTRGGLSKWTILTLVKAGFKGAFLSFGTKERLIKDVDAIIYDGIKHQLALKKQ
jgi:adenosine deaminase